MVEQVDQEAREDSEKALTVIMIFAILASTGYFFYLTLDRRLNFFYDTRRFMITILTAGDLFFALFSLFVYTRYTYESGNYDPGCATKMCATVYAFSYFPFVYGTGLICLCVELVYRHRIRAYFQKVEHSSLLMAGIPWLFGLVLILPLTMAELDWSTCRFDDGLTKGRMRAVIWISVVIPSTLAVLCCFIVKKVSFNIQPTSRPAPNSPAATSAAPQPSYTSLENAHDAQTISASEFEVLVEKQKVQNLVLATVFFVMVMPYALFYLATALNDDAEPIDPVPKEVFDRLFFWIVVVRSAVLPVLWARFPANASGGMYVARN